MRLLLGAFMFAFAAPSWAAQVAGVTLPAQERIAPGGPTLLLNGAGLRRKFIFKVYVIGLYLPQAAHSAGQALALAGPARLDMRMLRDVDAQEFTDALFDGLRANLSAAQMKAVEPQADRLAALMASVKEAKDGMRIALDWEPDRGTRVRIDGRALGAPIPGEDFYRGLLAIWLGPHPVQDDLKTALLGGAH